MTNDRCKQNIKIVSLLTKLLIVSNNYLERCQIVLPINTNLKKLSLAIEIFAKTHLAAMIVYVRYDI